MTQLFGAVGSDVNKLISAVEVKITGFLAKYNLSLATTDHLGHFSGTFFQIQRLEKRTLV